MTVVPSPSPAVAVSRLSLAIGMLVLLTWTYLIGIPRSGANPFDYFGYFTNLTSLGAAVLLIALPLAGALVWALSRVRIDRGVSRAPSRSAG